MKRRGELQRDFDKARRFLKTFDFVEPPRDGAKGSISMHGLRKIEKRGR